ncbi:MAG: hypothetical protein U0Y08_08095 [Bacteroidia bacterium]
MKFPFRPAIRWSFLAILAIGMVWTGFKRERKLLIIEQGIPTFINRYPKPTVAAFEKNEMKGTFGIKIAAKLQSSVLFSFIFMLFAAGILAIYSESLKVGKTAIIFYLLFMVLCFILLKLGDWGVDYRLSTGLSHYLEDLFLSPFLILALIVLIRFSKKNLTGYIDN